MRRPLSIIAATFCAASVFGAGAPAGVTTTAAAAAAQCRGTDRIIPKQVRFPRGRTMTVHLATGNRTSFTVNTPAGDTPEGADGAKDWSGELPETGDYTINIGTDATAAYTLEVTIR